MPDRPEPKASLIEELLPNRTCKEDQVQRAFLAKEENRIGVERFGRKIGVLARDGTELLKDISATLGDLIRRINNDRQSERLQMEFAE